MSEVVSRGTPEDILEHIRVGQVVTLSRHAIFRQSGDDLPEVTYPFFLVGRVVQRRDGMSWVRLADPIDDSPRYLTLFPAHEWSLVIHDEDDDPRIGAEANTLPVDELGYVIPEEES